MTRHLLIPVASTTCPRCGKQPQRYGSKEDVVIRGLPDSNGQVLVCEACWQEFLNACPSHVLPRSSSGRMVA